MRNNLEIVRAKKSYGSGKDKKFVLNNLNLTLPIGKIYCLLGASGSGRTTLISCILGIKRLDSGCIKVLNEKVSDKHALRLVNSIGYMPQDAALSPVMTIKETLEFFAKISQMNMSLFNHRYRMLAKMFKLPADDALIENLSAGERKRVSLTVALIHDPELLILDDPTIGLDIVICQKIWNFLRQSINSNSNLSVLMTTHYPHEAEKAHICGFMRNGRLLAEDVPKNIIERLNARNLDEAILELSNSNSDIDVPLNFMQISRNAGNLKDSVNLVSTRRIWEPQTLMALGVKKIQWIKRSKRLTFMVTLLPLIHFYLMCFTIGRPLTGIVLGIFNGENIDCKSKNLDLKNTQNLSCLFIDAISDEVFHKISFTNFADAFVEAKIGNVMMEIPSNFSNNFMKARGQKDTQCDIKIYSDQTNPLQFQFAKLELTRAYDDFIKNFMARCNCSLKYYQNQMIFTNEKGIKFEKSINYQLSMIPKLYLVMIIISSSIMLALSVNQYKYEKTWNRILLSGVNVHQLLLTEIILSIILAFLHAILTEVILYFHEDSVAIEDYGSLIGLVVLTSLSGCMIGILGAILFDNFIVLSIAGCSIFYIFIIGCDCISPFESMSKYLQGIMKILPSGVPVRAFQNVILKGHHFTHQIVFDGFITLMTWILGTLLLICIALKYRRYIQ
ncbi:ABC transporter G family member 23-like [Chironomus tepperi]|uniref:ABC transporter G family member 23-like n=1 Tax=Chironomus tepperi TaxID=113505 RepID=UPI00391F6576